MELDAAGDIQVEGLLSAGFRSLKYPSTESPNGPSTRTLRRKGRRGHTHPATHKMPLVPLAVSFGYTSIPMRSLQDPNFFHQPSIMADWSRGMPYGHTSKQFPRQCPFVVARQRFTASLELLLTRELLAERAVLRYLWNGVSPSPHSAQQRKIISQTYQIAVIAATARARSGPRRHQVLPRQHDFGLKFKAYDFGGERYLATGKIIDDAEIDRLRQHDAIFLGAIGHPGVKPGILEKGLLLRLRFTLDQYINLRPVKLFPGVETPIKNKGPEEIDYVVVRENSGGAYTGCGGNVMAGTPNEVATQEMIYTRFQVERALRYAFDLVRSRHSRKKPWRGLSPKDIEAGKVGQLTLCGKTNVLTYLFGLWDRAFHEIAAEYPDVKTDYAHVDATTMWMGKNPEWFDVIVTENLYGDIITDLGAMTQGGMGIAAGGNINPKGLSMFEPIGGSAPKYTGLNVINPLAAICAGAMMLDTLGERAAAAAIEAAVARVTPTMKSQSAGKMGFSRTELGDAVVRALRAARKA